MSRTIICDFDGVWVDSFGVLLRINQAALAGMGMTLTAEEYRAAFHGPIHHELRRRLGLTEAQQREFSDQKRRIFHEHYHAASVSFFPFADKLIARLSGLGRLHIVTASPAEAVGGLLEQKGLRGYFGEVAGFSLLGKRATLERLLDESRGAQGCFITDTAGDVREAAGLNLKVIAVAWGFHQHVELLGAGAQAVATNGNELVDYLQS